MKNNPFKILFIKPPIISQGTKPVTVPLAFLYLSSYVRKYLGEAVDIKLIDLRLKGRPAKALAKTLQAFDPDIIGISLLTTDRFFLDNWLGVLNRTSPRAKIIIGGPYATYEYEEILSKHKDLACAVLGEGEKTFLNFVTTQIHGQNFKRLKGIAYWEGDSVAVNEQEDYIEDLDVIPFPDYSLLNISEYCGFSKLTMNAVLANKKHTHVISSRACPYQCIYCHNIFGKTVRNRSPENFVSEIKWLYDELGIREFHIVDDIFNIDRTRMHEILYLIINSGMKIKIAFPNGIRGDLLNKEDIRLLQRAGAYMITFAVETASPRLQKVIRKNLNIENVMRNIDYASSLGLLTKGYFMIGFPGETVREIKSTVSLAIKSGLDFASFFIVVPFPKTKLDLLASQLHPEIYQGKHIRHVDYYGEQSFYFAATGYNLKNLQRMAYLRFYFPFRLLKTFIKVPLKRSMLSWPYDALQVFVPRFFLIGR